MFLVQYNGKFHSTRYLVGDEVQLISGSHVWIKGIFFDRPDGRIFEVYDHYASWFVPETAIHCLTFKGKLHEEMEAELYGSQLTSNTQKTRTVFSNGTGFLLFILCHHMCIHT